MLLGLLKLVGGLLQLFLHGHWGLGFSLIDGGLRGHVGLLRLLEGLRGFFQFLLRLGEFAGIFGFAHPHAGFRFAHAGLRFTGLALHPFAGFGFAGHRIALHAFARLRLALHRFALLRFSRHRRFALHRFALHRLAFLLARLHRFTGHGHRLGGFHQLVDGFLLILDCLGDVPFFNVFGRFLSVLGGVRLHQLLGRLGDFLLEVGQVLLCVGLHRVHRLLAELVGGFLGFVGGLHRFFDRFGDLLRGFGGVDLVRLQRGLVGDFLRLQFVEFLVDFVFRLSEVVGGHLGFVRGRHRLVFVEIGFGHVLVLGGVIDLLRGFGRDVLHLLADLFGRGFEVVLLFGDVVGFRSLVFGFRGFVRVGGDLLLVLHQRFEFLCGVFELGDVVAPLFDAGDLFVEGFFGILQGFDRLFLLRFGLGGVLLGEVGGGFVGGGVGLFEGVLHRLVVRQRQILEFFGLFGDVLLGVRGRFQRVGLGFLGQFLRGGLGFDRFVDFLGGLLRGGEGVGLFLLGRGD